MLSEHKKGYLLVETLVALIVISLVIVGTALLIGGSVSFLRRADDQYRETLREKKEIYTSRQYLYE